MIETISERIRLGYGAETKPILLKLIEMGLPEDSFLRKEEELLLELFRLLWQIPPPHINREWIQGALDLAWSVTDGFWEQFTPLLDELGVVIVHSKDLRLLDKLIELSLDGIKFKDYVYPVRVTQLTKSLFPHALKTGWDDGIHDLLAFGTLVITDFYTNEEYVGNPFELMQVTADNLGCYLNTGKPLPGTEPLIGHLAELYRYSTDSGEPLPPDLTATLYRLGETIERQRNGATRDLCLKKGFLLSVSGIVTGAIAAHNVDWLMAISSAFLEEYRSAYRLERLSVSYEDPLRKAYQRIRTWSRFKTPLDPTFDALDYITTKEEIDSTSLPTELYILAEFLLKASVDLNLKRKVLDELYPTHGIWVLRLLANVLYYTIQFSEDWVLSMETLGRLWNSCSFSTQMSPLHEEDVNWLITIFQACAGAPDVQTRLLHFALNSDIPLLLRELAVFTQIRYGSSMIDHILPMDQWQPKQLQVAVSWVLGLLKDSRAVPALLATTRDELPELRARGVWALGEIQDSKAFKLLLDLLHDPNLEVQLEAIRALGKLSDPQAILPLRKLKAELESHFEEVELAGVEDPPYTYFYTLGGPTKDAFLFHQARITMEEVLQRLRSHL